MFHKLVQMTLSLIICSQLLLNISSLYSAPPPNLILVTNTDGGFSDGSLGTAILAAVDGSIIDCSPIAGQTISLGTPLPAIGHSFTTSSSSITILGQDVTIDAGSNHAVFSLAYGSATITNFNIQNGLSKGGNGGFGETGGGGGVGGGGALYVHTGTTMTISMMSLNNNQAIGGAGGTGNTGGSGGGGGGFGGGTGGFALRSGATAGSGGGGGGNNGGVGGGRDGGVGIQNSFTNFAGAGGGGEIPGSTGAKSGGTNASIPAKSGGAGGIGSASNGAGAGGGGGSATAFSPIPPNGGSGFPGSNAIDATSPGTGIGGAGGFGFGVDYTYGAGGGGGGGNGGGAGYGTSGGGGGLTGPGGVGGVFGGGGGASRSSTGGNGGFGAGGGGGNVGGIDVYGLGGSGGSATDAPAGGGGGSGLGGAVFVQKGALLIVQDGVSFSENSTTAGLGGAAAGIGNSGGDGSSLGEDIFIQSGGSITFQIDTTLVLSNPIEGAGLLSEATGAGLLKSGTGTLSLNGSNTYLGDTLIQSGTLNLNGSIDGALHIESSGTLTGNATVNSSIICDGTISPGNSIGTIFSNDLNLSSASLYNVEINPTDSSCLNVTGTATLGGTLQVLQEPGSYSTQGQYTILKTTDGFISSFDSLVVHGIPGFQFSLEPDGDNLLLIYNQIPLPPTNLQGTQIDNKFLTQTDIVNVLKWNAPTYGSPPVVYKVYRNSLNILIGAVPADRKLEFKDHDRTENVAYTYYIVSVDEQKVSSTPAQITIEPK